MPSKSNPESESGKQIQEHRSDRGHKEPQMKVHNIVQEVVSKTISKKKKCKKAKWLSEEALQIPERKRGVKALKEKGKDTPKLNAEFQKIARRNKKAFLCECCKEIEENSRMRKPYKQLRKEEK